MKGDKVGGQFSTLSRHSWYTSAQWGEITRFLGMLLQNSYNNRIKIKQLKISMEMWIINITDVKNLASAGS